jgi:alpha-ribazole phosphatase
VEITLIRHPPALIPPGVCYGRLDVPLHPDAAGTLARIAAEVGEAAAIITSPARRCRAVAGMLPGTVREDARLLELDFGRWEGVAWDDVPRAELDTWARDPARFAPPGGESGGALLARVASFHAELEAHGTDCVVVSHGGPLKLLAALLARIPPDLLAPAPALGSVTRIRC